ncbi:glutamate racemase [Paenibacillus sp. BR2-3]|uniref:glutamate racemase n=1 Tax=Paenibacillus sp. BR2-3 TaxID=3048494 RepID=UPI0039779512
MGIAFFDSGIGGITVLHEAMKRLPGESFLYFADTLHVPYGTKTSEEVNKYVKQSIDQITREDVKAIVIACNTATSIAISGLRNGYDIPIIGMEPAVKPAVEMNRSTGKRVLVFATELTLKQSKYTDLVSRVDEQCIVDSLPLPELVEYCEALNFDIRVINDYFRAKLAPFNMSTYGTIVLGCTHYPFYKNILRKLFPDIQIVDGSAGTVRRLSQVLKSADIVNVQAPVKAQTQVSAQLSMDVKFMCSGNEPAYIRKMERALEII